MLPRRCVCVVLIWFCSACAPPAAASTQQPQQRPVSPDPQVGSAIFIHPDGGSVATWGAARLLAVGPDGELNWDRMESIGVYRGHLTNSLASTSNGAATVHAFGVKAPHESYGINPMSPLTSLSGKPYSILVEAQREGLTTAIINSGHLAEPGTGVFVANAKARANVDTITLQIIESGTEIIMGGGEALLLPSGVVGRHGVPGLRRDGRNMITLAEELGYSVVYSRDELLALPSSTDKVLGLFAPSHTFNDRTDQELQLYGGGPLYRPDAPTLAQMLEVGLRILDAKGQRFLVVVEEEGSDNFANANNAIGTLTALARADTAMGVALDYVANHPNTLVITAADSDAGGLEVFAIRDSADFDFPLDLITRNGAPLDGPQGSGSLPFVSLPDRFGTRMRFGIAWADFEDLMGGNVVRAHGLNAELLPPTVDNTDVYRMMYATIFGEWLP
ncbi:alkaline phosphatase [Gemmatimonadota bacterium]